MALKALMQLMEGPLALMSDLWLQFLMELQILHQHRCLRRHYRPIQQACQQLDLCVGQPSSASKRVAGRGRCLRLNRKLHQCSTVRKQNGRWGGDEVLSREIVLSKSLYTLLFSVRLSSNFRFPDWTEPHCWHFGMSISDKASFYIIG